MEEGGGERRERKFSPFFASIFPPFPQKRLILRLLINQLICITNNECVISHHKAFRADYNSRSTKINAPSAGQILLLREF